MLLNVSSDGPTDFSSLTFEVMGPTVYRFRKIARPAESRLDQVSTSAKQQNKLVRLHVAQQQNSRTNGQGSTTAKQQNKFVKLANEQNSRKMAKVANKYSQRSHITFLCIKVAERKLRNFVS